MKLSPTWTLLAVTSVLHFGLLGTVRAASPDTVTVHSGYCRIQLPARNTGVVEELAPVCETEAAEIFDTLGTPIKGARLPIDVRIVSTPEGIFGAAPEGTRPPPWSEAVAFPQHNRIVLSLRNHIGSPIQNLPEVLAHELSHLALRKALEGRPVPRWFSEGIAVHQSERSAFHRHVEVFSAARRNGLLPLDEIESYPEQASQVSLAYAQAADFVAVLLQEGGWLGIRQIIRKTAAGESFEDAVQIALGRSIRTMEREWRSALTSRGKWVALFTSAGAVWGLITALFLLAYMVTKRRKRRKLREMGEEEAALDRVLAVVDARAAATLPSHPKSTSLQHIPTKIRVDDDIHTLH